MKGPEMLQHFEDNWETEMGAWFPAERIVIRGKDLFDEFSCSSWMNYLLHAITGKQDERFSELVESIWVISTSFPDPRLWPNRIATLSGSSRSTCMLGLSGGIAASEASIYGLRPMIGAYYFFTKAIEYYGEEEKLENFTLEYLKKYKVVPGYGRPLSPEDERIAPLFKRTKSLGFADGDYVKLAFEVDRILFKHKKMKMNVAALSAAIAGDVGLSIREYYYLASLAFTGGMFPPMIDAFEKPEGAFFPLRIARLNYVGTRELKTWGE